MSDPTIFNQHRIKSCRHVSPSRIRLTLWLRTSLDKIASHTTNVKCLQVRTHLSSLYSWDVWYVNGLCCSGMIRLFSTGTLGVAMEPWIFSSHQVTMTWIRISNPLFDLAVLIYTLRNGVRGLNYGTLSSYPSVGSGLIRAETTKFHRDLFEVVQWYKM